MTLISDGHGGTCDPDTISAIVGGTAVSSDLKRARMFYEDFLGLECVAHAPGKLLVRDKATAEMMKRGERGGFVMEVTEVDEVKHPQSLLNHWGLTVNSNEEVDRIRAVAQAESERYGIKKVNPITKMHGSYQFYFIDMDNNWWEIENRNDGRSNEMVFEAGDYK